MTLFRYTIIKQAILYTARWKEEAVCRYSFPEPILRMTCNSISVLHRIRYIKKTVEINININ